MQTYIISRAEAGRPVGTVLRAHLRLSWAGVQRLVRERKVRLGGQPCFDPGWRVRAGQRVEVNTERSGAPQKPAKKKAGPRTASRGPSLLIRFADQDLVVVEKPAGLTTMRHAQEAAEFGARARRFLPSTLSDLLPGLLPFGPGNRPPRVRAVHRLDRDTSGLVVFARTPAAERHLGQQFRAHTIQRRYLAVVRGRALAGQIKTSLVRDRGDGRRGTAPPGDSGQRAVTLVRVLENLGNFTLVECRLETGRTHQVRIHLGSKGTPICGERVYDRPLHGQPIPDLSGSPRLALHAAHLGLIHPTTGKNMSWDSSLPSDLAGLVARLRSKKERSNEATEKDTRRKKKGIKEGK